MGGKSSSMLQDDEIKQISEETGFTSAQIEKLYARFAHLDRTSCGSLNRIDLISIPELAINPLCDRLIQLFFSDCSQDDERINFKQFIRVLATFRSTNNVSTQVTNHHRQIVDNNSTHPNSRGQVTRIGVGGKHLQTRNEVIFPSQDDSPTTRRSQDAPNRIGNDTSRIQLNGLNDGLRNKLLFVFKVYDADNDGRVSFNDLRQILRLMVGNYIEGIQLDKIASRAFVEADEDNDGYIEFHEFCKVFSGRDLNNKLRVKFFS